MNNKSPKEKKAKSKSVKKSKDEESFFNRLNYEEKKYQYLFKFNSYNDVLMTINHILRI